MFRTIVAGTAVAGALMFGAAGIAGATTPSAPTTTPTTATSGADRARATPAVCAKLPAIAGTRAEAGEQDQRAPAQGAGA